MKSIGEQRLQHQPEGGEVRVSLRLGLDIAILLSPDLFGLTEATSNEGCCAKATQRGASAPAAVSTPNMKIARARET
ncbi:MAG: hypothetical protein JO307_17620, partial [Bryobacterales bacterium]|nr:hypothetical protein [Bryobacterales bacterium]